jgi:hypothetical protein
MHFEASSSPATQVPIPPYTRSSPVAQVSPSMHFEASPSSPAQVPIPPSSSKKRTRSSPVAQVSPSMHFEASSSPATQVPIPPSSSKKRARSSPRTVFKHISQHDLNVMLKSQVSDDYAKDVNVAVDKYMTVGELKRLTGHVDCDFYDYNRKKGLMQDEMKLVEFIVDSSLVIRFKYKYPLTINIYNENTDELTQTTMDGNNTVSDLKSKTNLEGFKIVDYRSNHLKYMDKLNVYSENGVLNVIVKKR